MTDNHIQTQIRRAHLLMDALPYTHPKPAYACPDKTRRLMTIGKALGRIVSQGRHIDSLISEAHSALSRASTL